MRLYMLLGWSIPFALSIWESICMILHYRYGPTKPCGQTVRHKPRKWFTRQWRKYVRLGPHGYLALVLKVCPGLLKGPVLIEVIGDHVYGLIHLPLLGPKTLHSLDLWLGMTQHSGHSINAKRISSGSQRSEAVVDGREFLLVCCKLGFDHCLLGIAPPQHVLPSLFIGLFHDLPICCCSAHIQGCAGHIEESICSISLLSHPLVSVSLNSLLRSE